MFDDIKDDFPIKNYKRRVGITFGLFLWEKEYFTDLNSKAKGNLRLAIRRATENKGTLKMLCCLMGEENDGYVENLTLPDVKHVPCFE